MIITQTFNTKGMNVFLHFEVELYSMIHSMIQCMIFLGGIHEIAVSVQLNDIAKFTATKNHHRASTLCAYMDLPESEKDLFYRHMDFQIPNFLRIFFIQ